MRHWVPAILVGMTLGTALALVPPPSHAQAADAGAQLEFGVDMARRGLWNEALFRFKRALISRPGDAEVLNNIAVAYEALGLFDQALEAYKEALAANPGNRDLRSNYSRFLEFYQSFKPAEEPSADSEGGPADTTGDS